MKEGRLPAAHRDALILVVFSLLISLVAVFVIFPSQNLVSNTPDPYDFSKMGKEIAQGLGFHGVILGRRAPLYPVMVGAIYYLLGPKEWLIQIVHVLLLAGTCLLVRDIAIRVYASTRAGLIAGLMCAVHPSFLRYVPDFHLEVLLTFLVTLMAWASVRFHQRPSIGTGIAFGVAIAISTLTKAIMLAYPFVFAVFWLWEQRRELRVPLAQLTQRLLPLAFVFGSMALTIAPWTARNYHVSGKLVPVSTGVSDAFLRGFVFSKNEYITLREPPYTGAENEVNAWFRGLCAAEGVVWERDALADERILGKEAKRKLATDLAGTLRKSFVGIFTFWYQMTSWKTSLAAGAMALCAWVAAGFGVARARRERRPQWLLFAPVLYLNAFLAMLLALGRYSVPVLPILLVASAFGVDTLLGRLAKARAS